MAHLGRRITSIARLYRHKWLANSSFQHCVTFDKTERFLSENTIASLLNFVNYFVSDLLNQIIQFVVAYSLRKHKLVSVPFSEDKI